MFSKIRLIALSGLLVLALSMSYMTYTLIGDVGKLEERNEQLVKDLAAQVEDIKRLETSCKIDSEVAFETIERAEEMTQKIPEIMEALDKIEVKQNEVPKNEQTPKQASDAVRADSELMRLLDEAYCTAAGDSAYCTAR